MNATSASPAKPLPSQRILVWDAPVRVFHWLMVLSFAGAYLTAESERWRLAHVTLGYTMAGLVGLRLVWGLIGTRYARFSECQTHWTQPTGRRCDSRHAGADFGDCSIGLGGLQRFGRQMD